MSTKLIWRPLLNWRLQGILSKVVAVALMFACGTAVLWAAPPVRMSIKNGKVLGVSAEGVMVADGEKTYLVKPKKDQQVMHVTGKLRVDQLKPGMLLRFNAVIKGTVIEEELTDIKIFTVNDGFPPGILQNEPGSEATITGQLTRVKDNAISISAGRKKFTAKIAEGATIMVESIDYSIASPGDPVTVDGYYSPDSKAITGRNVVITVGGNAEPAAEPKKGKKAE